MVPQLAPMASAIQHSVMCTKQSQDIFLFFSMCVSDMQSTLQSGRLSTASSSPNLAKTPTYTPSHTDRFLFSHALASSWKRLSPSDSLTRQCYVAAHTHPRWAVSLTIRWLMHFYAQSLQLLIPLASSRQLAQESMLLSDQQCSRTISKAPSTKSMPQPYKSNVPASNANISHQMDNSFQYRPSTFLWFRSANRRTTAIPL